MENHELQEKLEVDSGAHKKPTHDPSCDYSLQAQHNDDGLKTGGGPRGSIPNCRFPVCRIPNCRVQLADSQIAESN